MMKSLKRLRVESLTRSNTSSLHRFNEPMSFGALERSMGFQPMSHRLATGRVRPIGGQDAAVTL
jgi:hypothetical protein